MQPIADAPQPITPAPKKALGQRLFFGILMILLVVGLVVLDARVSNACWAAATQPEANPAYRLGIALPMVLLLSMLVLFTVLEFGRLCRAGGYQPATAWIVFVALGAILIPWLELQQKLWPVDALTPWLRRGSSPMVLWLTGGLLGSCLVIMARRSTERAVAHLSVTLFGILYLGLLPSYAMQIRCLWHESDGALLLVYFILTVKASDIGAYLIGSAIGRHKLIPWLSPKKTIEGAFGALALSTAVAVAGMLAWKHLPTHLAQPLSTSQAVIFGLLMGVFGHMGDLVASLMKRDVGSKDSGHVVPAFGGLLDLVDSPVLTAPIAWWVLTFWGGTG